eukprot:11019663-Lingulodinium_polyedra.AAC.1
MGARCKGHDRHRSGALCSCHLHCVGRSRGPEALAQPIQPRPGALRGSEGQRPPAFLRRQPPPSSHGVLGAQ